MIVEDDPDFAASLQWTLLGAGYSTTVAYDGVSALDALREKIPDLITLDIKLPRKSGLIFYRQLKTDEAFQGIPVVVISGLSCRDSEMETFTYTFLYEIDNLPSPQAFFEKPVDKYVFLRVVEEILRPNPVTDPTGANNRSVE